MTNGEVLAHDENAHGINSNEEESRPALYYGAVVDEVW